MSTPFMLPHPLEADKPAKAEQAADGKVYRPSLVSYQEKPKVRPPQPTTWCMKPLHPLSCSSPGNHHRSTDLPVKTLRNGWRGEEWLERVPIFNRWNDEETFRHVFFYLEDAARILFENHESSLTDWTIFKSEFLKTFATVVRKERAALLLETHTQHFNEGVMISVEEMKRVFRRANSEMTEEKKLRFLMRGVKARDLCLSCPQPS